MAKPDDILVGPLTHNILGGASWNGSDDFPSNQVWADDVERILSHLEEHGQMTRFRSMLRGKLTQRDSALAEARASFFFSRAGFSITCWEPKGGSNSLGEFEIQWKSTSPIFVEVKGPRWDGELSPSERGNRKKLGKYQHAEVRSLDTIGTVISAIEKAKSQNKFSEGRPNLLAVYSSLLFVSPLELSRRIVVPKVSEALQKVPSLGGLLMIDAVCKGGAICYESLFVRNEFVDGSSRLPSLVEKALSSFSK